MFGKTTHDVSKLLKSPQVISRLAERSDILAQIASFEWYR